MNKENLKIAIEEIINHKNYKYFIENFDFETRKDFIENIETYNDYLEELLITDENLSIFSKNIFTPEEAESLYKNINNYDEIKSLFIIFNLSDERKETIIKNTPYDEDYKDLIIDSINDEKTKNNLKKFYNLDEHIKNLTDEEKLSLINSLEKDYNILKVLKTIKDELKYEYIINNNLDEYQIKEISKSIKNEEILYNIIILDNIKNSSILNEFIELLSDEYKSKTLKTILFSEGNININDEIVNIILNMESKYQEEFLLNEELYFNKDKFDYFKTKEIFSKIVYTDNIIDFVYKMIKNKTMPISFVNNNIKSDIIKLKIIKEQEVILDNTDLETMFNSLKTETYIKECIPLIIDKISITKIIKKIPTDQEKLSFIETLSEEQLKEIQQKQYKDLFNEETTLIDLFSNENIKLNLLDSEKISILEYISDETKLNIINSNHKLLNNSKDYKLRLIISLNDDNKVKLIEENKIDSYLNIAVVLSKIKDEKYNQYKIDKLTELINIAKEKGDSPNSLCYNIISSFDNEEIKYNLVKNIKDLDTESKSLILASINNEIYDIEKIKFIEENKSIKHSYMLYILKSIKNTEIVIKLLESNVLETITKIYILESYEDKIFDNIKSKTLEEILNDETIIINTKANLINSIKDNKLKLYNYIKLNNFEYINDFIMHNDYILTEKEIIEPIIDIYSNKYIVNKEHLTIMVKKYGYEIIRAIENDNIKNIINSNGDIFNKLIEIFDVQNTLLVEDKHIDSVLYALLQRDFRTNEEDTLNVFNKIKETIENNNYEETIRLLKEIKEFLDSKNTNYIPDILIKHNIYDYNKLIVNTFDKEQQKQSLSIINEITNKYILEKRNEHSNKKFKEFKNSLNLDKTYEKNTLIKEFIVKESITKIKELLLSIENISDEEKNLIENEEILSDCINLKRGLNTNNSKAEVIKYIKLFNNLLEKLYLEKKLNYIGNDSIKAIYNIPKNNGSIVNILKEIDIDLLNEKLFNNDELFKELITYLKNYRLVGWGITFSELADKVDMDLDESTIASFINNFYKISEVLNKKLEERNKDLEEYKKRKITLTEFLEEAEVYGSDSYKYKILLGQEDYRLIRTNPPNNASPMPKKERLNLSVLKTIDMYKREYISIPPADININLENNKVLNFSVGYTKETINLTYGERTGACMRIGGAADSLYNLCLLNENGFHIKITDPNTNKFISRVSGFRNGNTIFLNQLRNSTSKEFTNEDLIEGLKIFMNNIIEQTESSSYPIENVIISDGYAMSGREKLEDLKINVKEGYERFYTDVSNTNAILLTSSTSSLMPIKLGVENRELYETARLKVQKLDNKKNIILTINKLKMINELLNGISLENTTIYDENNTIFNNAKTMHYGEDWYILLDEDNNVIEEFTIDYQEKDKALNELEELKQSLSIGGKVL